MIDTTITNMIRRGEIDINNQSLFFSIIVKGLMRKLQDDLTIRNIAIPHIILNTGDDLMYLELKGHDQSKEPYEITNEDYIYNAIPRCMVNPKGINLIPDQLTTPYSRGVLQYENEDSINTYNAEFRRMPLTMSMEMSYYVDTYTDLLELTQKLISKLSFIQTYYVTYMGQSILCSYRIPESLEGDFSITLDGAYSDNKSRKLSVNIELETNFPIFNNRSIIQADNIIKKIDFDINKGEEILKQRKYETK
jgi:hypothetical protein